MKSTSLSKHLVDRQHVRQKHLLARSVHASVTKAFCRHFRHFELYTHMRNKSMCCMQIRQCTACKHMYMPNHRLANTSRCQWMQNLLYQCQQKCCQLVVYNWLFTIGDFVLTYLRASYVPEATTDRKPVAKVLLHVLQQLTKTVITEQT